jgi:mono/diheme cytochrome c family protein
MLASLLSLTAGAADRWYDDKLVANGSQLFQQKCAVCHGANAEGTKEWKKTDSSGHYLAAPMPGIIRSRSWYAPSRKVAFNRAA